MKIKAKQMPPMTGFTNGKVYDVLERYNHGYLVINDEGDESKIHEFNTEIITGHPHADLIMEYAKIAQHDDEPWKHFETLYNGEWLVCNDYTCFNSNLQYRLKPRTININGFEVPEPVREKLKNGTKYYSVDLFHGVLNLIWCNSDMGEKFLKAGLIHLTREAAEKHVEALLSFTKNKPL